MRNYLIEKIRERIVGEGLGLGEGEELELGEGLAVVPRELLIYRCVHLILLLAVALLVWVRA